MTHHPFFKKSMKRQYALATLLLLVCTVVSGGNVLKEAKEAVEGAPTTLKEGLSKEDAEKVAAAFKEVGATCEIK